MPSLTLSIPADLKAQMGQFPEINWSEVARQAIVEKTRTLQTMQRLLAKSSMTAEGTVEYGRQIKQRVWHRHRRAS